MIEWKYMWELTTWDKKFNGVDKSMQPKVIKYYYYLANELSELESPNGDIRILYTTDKVAYANSNDVNDNISEGEVVTIPWGGNLSIKYFKGKFVTADNRIATSNDIEKLSNKFLYYWMLSQSDIIESFYRGAGIKHPSMKSVLSLKVPVPSMSEQNHIVGILDTFTDSIENLKQQIAQRRKQYEFYRDHLLDLEGKEGVEMKTLKGIVKSYCTGATPNKGHQEYYEGGTIPWLRTQDVKFNEISEINSFVTELAVEKTGVKWIPANCVIVAISGATAGRCAINKIPTTTNQHCLNLEIDKEKALYKYVYYCIHNAYAEMISKKQGVRGDLNTSIILGIKIPIPSLNEQQHILSFLDTFEASISNLEAQLEQRQKQYEYYRNQLLTFE